MNRWQPKNEGAVKSFLDFRTFVAVCLLLLPFYAALSVRGAAPASPGMGAPPPPVLESFRALGGWGSLERRVLGAAPRSYGLTPPARLELIMSLVQPQAPELGRAHLALQGQWRLEGG